MGARLAVLAVLGVMLGHEAIDEAGAIVASSIVVDADGGRPVEVEYGGCKEVWLEEQEPRCVFEPRLPLRLWVVHLESAGVTVAVDGEAWPVEEYLVDGMNGFGLEVQLPPHAQTITVEFPGLRPAWSLALQDGSRVLAPPRGVSSSNDVNAELGRAFQTSLSGEHREAARMLDTLESTALRYPEGRAAHASFRGLVYWGQGRFHEAAISLRQGVTFAMRLKDTMLKLEALPLYAVTLAELGYHEAAAEWGEQVLTFVREQPDEVGCVNTAKLLSTVGYIQVLRARQHEEMSVDPRPLFMEALELVGPSGRCPQPDSAPAILLSLADVQLLKGEPMAALATLAEARIGDAPSFDQQLRLRDVELRALQAVGRDRATLQASLERSRAATRRAGSGEGRWRLALREGDLLAQWGQHGEAIVAYRRAEEEAQRIAELAAVGVGRETAVTLHDQSTERLMRLLIKEQHLDQALCVAREAQARRIQAVVRELTPAQRKALDVAIEHYEVARGEVDDALTRGRLLPRKDLAELGPVVAESERRLSEVANEILRARSTWRPSCEELVPRGRDEMLLGLYPTQQGWLVFAQDGAEAVETSVWELDGGPEHALHDPELSQELLVPLEGRLDEVQRVRVLASGVAQGVDVHLLEWEGRPLVDSVSVVYGAELPPTMEDAAQGPIALLVADPTETLYMARAEVLVARIWLALQGGWVLQAPTPEEADRQRIREALAQASFFYFAGHGEHDVGQAENPSLPPYAGGTQAWPARLRLTPPTVLEIQDVLMLESAPRHVALIGCETGVSGGGGGGMSLALAFLVAGAEEVVATPVAVDDEVARATGIGLLAGVGEGDVDLADGLRQAQAGMLARGERVGRYRVWVR